MGRLEGDTVAQLADGVVARLGAGGPSARPVAGPRPHDRPVGADGARTRLGASSPATTGAREVWVADDAVTAHAGATPLGWGVSVAAGTGVACLAVPRRRGAGHRRARLSCSGDEGGGFWIGRAGLAAVLRARRSWPDDRPRAAARTLRRPRRPGHVASTAPPRPSRDRRLRPHVLEAARPRRRGRPGDRRRGGARAGLRPRGGRVGAAGDRPPCRVALGGRLWPAPSLGRASRPARREVAGACRRCEQSALEAGRCAGA